jgi:hypothetical protein
LEAWTQATEKTNRLNNAEEDEMRAYAIHTAKKKKHRLGQAIYLLFEINRHYTSKYIKVLTRNT